MSCETQGSNRSQSALAACCKRLLILYHSNEFVAFSVKYAYSGDILHPFRPFA